jgi:hypothetical protein
MCNKSAKSPLKSSDAIHIATIVLAKNMFICVVHVEVFFTNGAAYKKLEIK